MSGYLLILCQLIVVLISPPAGARARSATTGITLVVLANAAALSPHVRVRVLVVVLALLGLLLAQAEGRRTRSRVAPVDYAPLLVLGLTACYFLLHRSMVLTPGAGDRLWRFLVEFPTCALLGALVSTPKLRRALTRQVIALTASLGVLAVVETAVGRPLILTSQVLRDLNFRSGRLRAQLGAEHPLVLASILLVGVAFVMSATHAWPRASLLLLLGAGIVATGSRGAAVILMTYLLWRAASARFGWSRAYRNLARVSIASVVLWLVFAGSASVTSLNADTASAEYRRVLYTAAFESIGSHPLGWGLEGLAQGRELIATSFGILDLSNTVDSELALAIFDFGLAGLAFWLGVTVLPLFLPRHNVHGEALAVLVASGLYLAIHAWAGLGGFAFFILGGAIAERIRLSRATRECLRGPRLSLDQERRQAAW